MWYSAKVLFIGFCICFANVLAAQPTLFVENTQPKNTQLSEKESKVLSEAAQNWSEILESQTLFQKANVPEGVVEATVSEDVLRNRIQAMDAKTPIAMDYNSVVHAYVEKYLRMGNYFGRVMALAEFYYPLFEEKMAAQNIPKEIIHLAIVESKLDARANSRMGAKGLWQFMYPTAKAMGLEINSYVDERYDPIKSTEAAAKYLKYLHENVGDWNLALAAYNCGLGNVNKAVNRSGGQKNYWNIRNNLPRETRGYIPSFIAANYVMTYYKQQNIRPDRLRFTYFDTDTVHVKKKLTFSRLADFLNMSSEELEFLNPQYKLKVIPQIAGKQYYVRLPKSKINYFTKNESIIYSNAANTDKAPEEKVKYVPTSTLYDAKYYHKVIKGDTLYKIAQKYGKTIEEIRTLNKMTSNVLHSGQYIQFAEKPAKE